MLTADYILVNKIRTHGRKIHDLVLADRRLKVREIAETIGISKDCVGHILHEILGMRKLSAQRDGCRVCSLRTTSATVRPSQSSVSHV